VVSGKHIIVTEIVDRLCSVGLGSWSDVNFENENAMAWFAAAEQAIDALFVISSTPEQDSRRILLGLQEDTFETDETSSLALSRFFFVCGHIALKLLLYTEEVSTAVKKGNSNRSLAKQVESDNAKKQKKSKKGNKKKGGNDDNDEEEVRERSERTYEDAQARRVPKTTPFVFVVVELTVSLIFTRTGCPGGRVGNGRRRGGRC